MNIIPLCPDRWKDYELLDAGRFEKLERFGKYILVRPEPQALWDRGLSDTDWKNYDVKFFGKSPSTGEWKKRNKMPDQWQIGYDGDAFQIQLRLGLTAFKHVGVFPEQAVNWDYIAAALRSLKTPAPRFLNLFAYTGAASVTARACGAQVTHVDSVKQVVTWANENMQLSGLSDIRWMVDDAVKFVQREMRRGNTYHGIILDPPAFGHGPKGEKWKLEDMINSLVTEVSGLLDPVEHFLILNTYSLGFSAIVAGNILQHHAPAGVPVETGELYLKAASGSNLPLGVWGRFQKKA